MHVHAHKDRLLSHSSYTCMIEAEHVIYPYKLLHSYILSLKRTVQTLILHSCTAVCLHMPPSLETLWWMVEVLGKFGLEASGRVCAHGESSLVILDCSSTVPSAPVQINLI